MGKNKKDSFKTNHEKRKRFPSNNKNKKAKDTKPKPTFKKQNNSAELIRQKKEAEKAEKERRIMEIKKKRLEKTKIISKKTSRGQPLMKNRIEYLLKQIQEMKKQ